MSAALTPSTARADATPSATTSSRFLFVVFDVETIFLFPWAVKFKAFGLFGLLEMLIFLVILIVGYIWVWKKGALEWV